MSDKNIKVHRPLVVWAFLLIAGLALKGLHWPGGTTLILFGSAGGSAVALTSLLQPLKRNVPIFFMGGLSIIWLSFLLYDVYFNGENLHSKMGFLFYGSVFFITILFYGLIILIKPAGNRVSAHKSWLFRFLDVDKTSSALFSIVISGLVGFWVLFSETRESKGAASKPVEVADPDFYLMSNGTSSIYLVGETYTAKVFLNNNALYAKGDYKMAMTFKPGRYNMPAVSERPITVIGDTGYVSFRVNGDSVAVGEEKIKHWSVRATISLPEKDTVFGLTQAYIVKK